MTSHEFRALWPVLDPTRPIHTLLAEAEHELPDLAARAHAHVTGPGRWELAPAHKIPGSGRVTDTVLIYRAPARPTPRRDYHR